MTLELQAGRGPKLTMGLPPVLGETPDKAVSFLRQAGGLLFKLKNADAYVRLEMGRQLLLIRGQKLWREMECRNYLDDRSPEGRPVWANEEARRYISWQDFLANGFPIITGLQRRMGYICMTLADSEVLKRLGPRIREFKSVQNAIEIAMVEKKGDRQVTPAMIEAAATLTREEFAEEFRLDKPVLAANVEGGGHKQFLVENLIDALDEDHLQALRNFIERALPRCGDSANDVVDMMEAAVVIDWQNERTAERAQILEVEAGS